MHKNRHAGRRRSFSESSLCGVSLRSLNDSRPHTPDLNKCMMPVKRVSWLSKYLIYPTPPKNRDTRPKLMLKA